MEFNTPIRKKNLYISTSTKNIFKTLFDTTILKINTIDDNKLEVFLKIKDTEQKDYLNNFELTTLNIIKTKNTEWFTNSLTDEQINEFYESSFDLQTDVFKCYIYKNYYPNISSNDTQYNSIFDLNNLDNLTINIDIRFIGIYIHSGVFYNSWMIKSIFINEEDIDMHDKNIIYDSWDSELIKKEKEINEKIEELTLLKKNMWDIYNHSKNIPEWKNELENLRTLLANFFI
tara:strand:- start:14605 stop:15297 length:693 start_codon:yes stop_codon:yes gene_type:complete